MNVNLINITKAFILSAFINAAYILYISSSNFQAQFSTTGNKIGKMEAFQKAAENTIGFWPRILESWAYGFAITFLTCILLLIWVSKNAPNKSLQPDA